MTLPFILYHRITFSPSTRLWIGPKVCHNAYRCQRLPTIRRDPELPIFGKQCVVCIKKTFLHLPKLLISPGLESYVGSGGTLTDGVSMGAGGGTYGYGPGRAATMGKGPGAGGGGGQQLRSSLPDMSKPPKVKRLTLAIHFVLSLCNIICFLDLQI